MELSKRLKEQGWHLTDDGIKKLIAANGGAEGAADVRKIIATALDIDYRDIAGGALPTKRDDTIAGRIVLQVQKVRNISAPKANEESKAAPRFLQLELSDGVTTIQALELETIAALSLNVPPGTKLYFRPERLQLMQGFLILRSAELQVLGGRVEALVEKWELARTMLKYARSGRRMSGASGPPPWIAFGKKMDAIKETMPRDRNFKSLLAAGEKDKDKDSKENEEFNAMRTEAIAEASKAGAKKIFGGGGQQILDHNVKKILEKGYSEEEAKLALRSTNNNLERALYNLKRRQDYNRYDDEATTSQREGSTVQTSKFGRGGGGGPPREREFAGRRGGGAASLKDEAAAAKPAGNVSLFDFLTDKLPANTEPTSVSQSAAATSTSTLPSYHTSSSTTSASKFDKSKSDVPKSNYKYTSSKSEEAERTRSKFENNLSSSFNAHRSTGGPPQRGGGRSERQERGDYNTSEHSSNSRYSNARGSAGGSSRGGRGGNSSTYQGTRPSYQEGYSSQRNFSSARDSGQEQRSTAGGTTRGHYNPFSGRGGGTERRAPNERSSAQASTSASGVGPEERSSQPRSGTSSGGYDSRQKASDQQQSRGSERYGHFNENKPYEKNRYNQRENNNKGTEGSSSRQQQGSYNSNNSSNNNNNSNSNADHSARMNKLVESTTKLKIDKTREQNSSGGGGRPQKQPTTQQTQPKQQQQYSPPENTPQPSGPSQQHYAATSQTSQPKYAQQQQQQNQNQNFSNGFNPSKIIGFQNKETNDFALTLLKSQGVASTSADRQQAAAPPPPTQSPHTYIPAAVSPMQQHPPLASPYGNPATYLLHSPQAAAVPPPALAGQYGMVPGDGWLWKIGDLCLAKYWDDGRYYEAEITAISAKTCVVFFHGYGNHEEVLKSDCLPITDANHCPINNFQQQQQVVPPPPPPVVQPNGFQRGGGGSQRYRGERQVLKVYVPPPKRDN